MPKSQQVALLNAPLGWFKARGIEASKARFIAQVWSWLESHATFYRLHFAFFILMAFIGTFIMWGIGTTKGGRFSFVDCLLGITSALCLSGLTAVPVEDIPTGGQVLLMLMMIIGSQTFMSLVPLLVKKHRYWRVAKSALENNITSSTATTSASTVESNTGDPENIAAVQTGKPMARVFSRSEPDLLAAGRRSWQKRSSAMLEKLSQTFKGGSVEDAWMAEMFKKQESEHIREIFQEHQATGVLIKIISAYIILVQLIGFFIAWPMLQFGSSNAANVIRKKQVNVGFFTLFAINSAFCNVGYILSNENMVPFNYSGLVLLDMTVVIFLGNTMYPPCLRAVIWLLHRYDRGSRTEAYQFLLEHPRKCYTHLFPPKTSLWLFLSVLVMNTFQVVVMYALDWNSSALQGLEAFDKVVNGVFQCANTRSGGMNSVSLTGLSPTTMLIFAIMMYIACYPVFLSRQYTRHKSGDDEASVAHLSVQNQRDILDTGVSSQLRRLLAQDTAYLFMGTFFICCSINRDLKYDPVNYNIFTVIFEVISGYAGVGLSYGYSCSLRTQPGLCVDEPVSFCGKWSTTGKTLLVILMFLGRHRGMPDSIDSAILLHFPPVPFLAVRMSADSRFLNLDVPCGGLQECP